jgi:FixJ family two-component response regulator
MSEPTVFLVDDDAAVRDALALLLSFQGIRSLMFASAEDFLRVFDPGWPGCLLTDLKMPGMSGLDLQTALRGRGCDVPVIVLTAHGDAATARAALKNGALDFLEKPVENAVLLDVIGNAFRIDAERRSERASDRDRRSRLERLTPRERSVLQLIVAGLQHKDVGERLGISPRTVEVYKSRIMEKLDCRNNAELAAAARGDAG